MARPWQPDGHRAPLAKDFACRSDNVRTLVRYHHVGSFEPGITTWGRYMDTFMAVAVARQKAVVVWYV